MKRLRALLERLDGKGYKAYKALEGSYEFPDFTLQVDHVQGDPYADASRIRVRVSTVRAGVLEVDHGAAIRRVALEDFLARAVQRAIARHVRGARGTGRSGEIHIAAGGQEILQRNAVLAGETVVEARLRAALPALGRRIAGADAVAMLLEELPRVVRGGLLLDEGSRVELAGHLDSAEDQHWLRGWLAREGLVAFIADGAMLARRSGADDHSLLEGALGFRAPPGLAREPVLPHAGRVRGMGIPRGVTLIVGGGFHGKSTLLRALERGIYDHIPGDGRERVVSDPTAVKIRAEDGRAVRAVDISPFIDNLPFATDSRRFTTDNASGSTSQAANIMEALACGGRLLLIDEDTSATNFMIRDQRMQALVSKDKEPITPLVHRIRELYGTLGVSTVLVMGGSGDYFSEADTVIMMERYEPQEVTAAAKRLATPLCGPDIQRPRRPLAQHGARIPDPASLHACRGDGRLKIQARSSGRLRLGAEEIDLSALDQLVDTAQALAIGYLIRYYAERFVGDGRDVVAGLRAALEAVQAQGLDVLPPYVMGELALPRLHEAVAALNRLRCLQIQ